MVLLGQVKQYFKQYFKLNQVKREKLNLKDISNGEIYRPYLNDVYRFSYNDLRESTPIGVYLYSKGLYSLSTVMAAIELFIFGVRLEVLTMTSLNNDFDDD